jgi:hypothetical protein
MDSLPLAISPPTPERRQADRFADLDRRVRALESRPLAFPSGAGVPSGTQGIEGSPYADTVNTRFWLRISGTWRYVAMT